MTRIDLHTHSEASIDGGLSPDDYAYLLKNEILDVIAITDHNRIDFAKGMQKALGDEYIIVGQEITTSDGDIIGLYLDSPVEPGLSAEKTADIIHSQGGLVYIPHPFEKVRDSIQDNVLSKIKHKVDILETHNGRALTRRYQLAAETWAVKNNIPSAGSSDAHGKKGVGRTYTTIEERPSADTLPLLLANGSIKSNRPPYRTYFYPKLNRTRNFFKGYRK